VRKGRVAGGHHKSGCPIHDSLIVMSGVNPRTPCSVTQITSPLASAHKLIPWRVAHPQIWVPHS
jgi:hypothetical protein